MDIVPIWKSTYYETTASSVEYRIMCEGGEIFHGRAVKSPSADKIRIPLNAICADYLDSIVAPEILNSTGDTFTPMLACQEFDVEVLDYQNGTYSTAMTVTFSNDTSYEEQSTEKYSEPINGHSAAGQILPYSVIATASTSVCFEY